jgi:hypothetical protein
VVQRQRQLELRERAIQLEVSLWRSGVTF